MKKSIMFIIILILFSISAVFAANDLQNHDFDGLFSMDVPENADFEKTNRSQYIRFDDLKDNLSVYFINDTRISDETIDYALKNYAPRYGYNLTSEENILKSDDGYAVVNYTNGTAVLVCGNDLDELKELSKTVQWRD